MTKITRQKNGYSVISNSALRDPKLSARSKGLYAYIMTLPEDWQIYKEELYKHFTEGRDALNKAMKELIQSGYVEVMQTKENGKFGINEYIIKDTAGGKPFTENPSTEKPLTENPQLLNTEELSTEEVITDNTPHTPQGERKSRIKLTEKGEAEREFNLLYDSYPKKRGKEAAKRKYIQMHGKIPPVDELIRIVEEWKKTEDWTKQNGQFIPLPATWLNQRRWEDELPYRKKTERELVEEYAAQRRKEMEMKA